MSNTVVVFLFLLECLVAHSIPNLFTSDIIFGPRNDKSGAGNGAENENTDYEIVHLSRDAHPMYSFNAFGRDINLNLKPNEKIISEYFKTYLVDGDEKQEVKEITKPCYYLHADNFSSAAINFCYEDKLHGLLFFEKYVMEIAPVHGETSNTNSTAMPHMIKKSLIKDQPWADEFHLEPPAKRTPENSLKNHKMNTKKFDSKPVLEAALFFDEAAYKIFAPYFDYNVGQIRDMLLAYMNGVQALYHHPSIGKNIDIMLTHLEIFRKQPQGLPDYEGERESLLTSFCNYHAAQNPSGDDNPLHWDIGLYISGLDFFAIEKGRKSGTTMGLAVVGGVCLDKYSCIIAEFGVTNVFGKPYPSAGFTSVFILAHEIGHSLGMHHDGYTNDCPKEGFIMSPSRGVFGETLWSRCSAEIMNTLDTWATCLYDTAEVNNELDHRKFGETPGLVWNLKKQCELLLKDKDADIYSTGNEEDVCQNVQCRTPHRAGFYYSGPAVEGTLCGNNKWCKGGECVTIDEMGQNNIIVGEWSEWSTDKCQSGCILNSKGFRSRKRVCNNPSPVNTNEGCDGLSYEVLLCSDNKICRKNKKETSTKHASRKCKEFSKLIYEIDKEGVGLQAPHESDRLWMGCTIFCRRSDKTSFYTPRIELNDLGVDPYFPDGTWCHFDGDLNYYCRWHHCLPEDFHFNKNMIWDRDLQMPQNALPETIPLSDTMRKYLSTDDKGKPLLKSFNPNSTYWDFKEDAWETKDYIEIP
ncbi:unnamed protein product [Nezara viridula]|uniref:Peptidase M12B domain-containing protein n=1 Tax=Nezara viridula TaxID=85310 RepID=A0A9P0GZ90_NEZVI|nr:unnamed protein product [Nezara viridula]